MAMEMSAEGLDGIGEMLGALEEQAEGVAARGLYEGAGIMASAIVQAAQGIQTEKFQGKRDSRKPSPEEKEIVMAASVGIARFEKNGSEVNTSIGYQNTGYAELAGKTVAVPKVVSAINSGTSFMKKQPFVRKARTKATAQAVAAIRQSIEAAFDEIGRKYQGNT